MSLKLQAIETVDLTAYNVLALGTKGEVAAWISAFLASGESVSQVAFDVSPAQVAAMRKALADQGAADTHTIQCLTTVTGTKTHTVKRTKKDGTPIQYDVTREQRRRDGVFIEANQK